MSGPGAGPDRGYVLHSYPYRETSLLLQVWTEKHGRFAAVAKGARRPKSAARGVLVPFQPLALAWFGRGEVKTLKNAEPAGPALPLAGASLLSAFYLNELLLKLIHRDDPHERLWVAYDEAIGQLRERSRRASGVPGLLAAEPGVGESRAIEPVLRRFELAMLRELGFAAELGRDAETGAAIDAEQDYWYVVERGPIPATGGSERADAVKLSGLTLVHLERGRFDDARTAGEAKNLMRMLIHHCLAGQELSTRAIVRDLRSLEDAA
ncbi:DNA repair protein recO [sediment metagenome]|uniref:DNA repair protein RecO n=1 Tax=sediment metagenome TaxID=749907 RepID=D9PKI8_9ZZZZ